MIGVLGKEDGSWFEPEEFLNFPCEDLLRIDGLWLQYSQINGVSKFGFSLQKEIIKKCGYKLDGNYPTSEVWDDFCHEVGWRDKKTRTPYPPLYTLDVDTKTGALPALRKGGTGHLGKALLVEGRGGRVSSLSSRLLNCSR